MTTRYPSEIDSYGNIRLARDRIDSIVADDHNSLRSAVVAIEQTLGTNPQSGYGTVKDRLTYVESQSSGAAGQASGDLDGYFPHPKVVKLQGRDISSIAPNISDTLSWNGARWIPTTVGAPGAHLIGGISHTADTLAGLNSKITDATLIASTTSAGGDLSGIFPNPTVSKLEGYAIINTQPTDGYALTWSAGSSQWEPQMSHMLDIRLFGAIPDDISKASMNSTAIQKAFNSGKNILIPKGIFYFNTTLNLPTTGCFINGLGHNSILAFTGVGSTALKCGATTHTDSSIKLSNFKLQSSAGATDKAIEFTNTWDVTIEDVFIYGYWTGFTTAAIHCISIQPNNYANVRILNSQIMQCKGDGIRFEGNWGIATVENCRIDSNDGYGIYNPHNLITDGPTQLNILNSIIEGNTKNQLRADRLYNSIISGCFFENSGSSIYPLIVIGDYIGTLGDCICVTIQNCMIGSGVPPYQLIIGANSLNTTSNVKIIGNNFTSTATIAHIQLKRINNVTIDSNEFDNPLIKYTNSGFENFGSIYLYDENGITFSGGSLGTATNVSFDGYLRLKQISNPNSTIDKGYIFVKNDSGDAELNYLDDQSRITQITKDGYVNVNNIRGKTISTHTPTDGYALVWNNSANAWSPQIQDAYMIQMRKVSSAAPTDGYALTWNTSANNWQSNKPIPGGTAGGDLSGTYPRPTVDGIQGRSVEAAVPTDGYALTWSASASPLWISSKPIPGGTAGGDLSGTYPRPTVNKIQGNEITIGSYDDGYALTWDDGTSSWILDKPIPGGTAGGDLSGTYPRPTVDGIQGRSVEAAAPTDGYALTWSASASPSWISSKPIPGGTAGGDLSGTYPRPTVDGIQGRSVEATTPTDGYALTWNTSLSQWENNKPIPGGTAGGDLSGTYPRPTVNKIQGNEITIGSYDDGYALTWDDGTSSWILDKPIPGGTAGGDLSGTYPNPIVAKIEGYGVSTSQPTDGYAIVWNTSQNKYISSSTFEGLKVGLPPSGIANDKGISTTSNTDTLALWSLKTDAASNIVIASVYDRNAASITNAATMRLHSFGWTNNSDVFTELASVRCNGDFYCVSNTLQIGNSVGAGGAGANLGISTTVNTNVLNLCGVCADGAGNISTAIVADVNSATINSAHKILSIGWINNSDTYSELFNFTDSQFQINSAASARILGDEIDGGSVVAVTLGSSITYSTSGAKLLSIVNNANERMNIDYAGDLQVNKADNGQYLGIKYLTELYAVPAAADGYSIIQLPTNSLIVAVTTRVITTIPTATTFNIGIVTPGEGTGPIKYGENLSVNAGTINVSTINEIHYNTDTISLYIKPNATPATATGTIRLTVNFFDITPPTS